MSLRFYRYRRRHPPTGWMNLNGRWSKPGIAMEFSDCVISDLPSHVDDLDADIPMFRCLRENGVDISDFYEYRGEPRTFKVWLPETEGKPLADKMRDVVNVQLASRSKP